MSERQQYNQLIQDVSQMKSNDPAVLEIKPEEEREIDINQHKTTEEVVRSMNQPQKKEPEPAPAVQA